MSTQVAGDAKLTQARSASGFPWRFTTPLFLGSALNPINSSLIATALEPVAEATHVSIGRTSVLVAGLYLASAVAQPTAGKLSEAFGPRRVFQVGILLVLVGGIVGGVAQNLTTLIVARVLIGLGTSTGYPSAMLIIRRRASDDGLSEPPSRVLGGLAIAGTATAAVGLPIGGVLVGWLDWRATFLINVPVALVTLATAVFWIPKDAPVERRPLRELADRIDAVGIIGFAGALTALLVFLLSLPGPDWAALAIAAAMAIGLVWWELRAATPFLDVRLLGTNLPLTRTYLRFGLTMLGSYTIMYGISQWLEALRGFSPEQTGLLLLPLTAVAALSSAIVSRRNVIRGPLLVAGATALLGAIGILLLTAHSPVIAIVAVTLLFGVMGGTTAVGNQTALYAQAPPSMLGTAAGLLRTFGYLGAVASSAITSIVFHHSVEDRGLHTIAVVLVAVSAVVLVMTIADRRLRRRPNLTPTSSTHPSSTGDQMPDTPAIDPAATALLLMDFEPAVLGAFDDADAVLAPAEAAVRVARAAGLTIGYVRVGFDDADYAAAPAHNKNLAAAAAGRHMFHEDAVTQVHPRLDPHDDDIMVRKSRVGAFSTTDLDEQLRGRGIDTLVLAGIRTGGVLLTTVREASDLDYQIYVLADASADLDSEIHDLLTRKVFPQQGTVITVDELDELLT